MTVGGFLYALDGARGRPAVQEVYALVRGVAGTNLTATSIRLRSRGGGVEISPPCSRPVYADGISNG